MSEYDPVLGKEINKVLTEAGIETPMIHQPVNTSVQREILMGESCKGLVQAVGLDLEDDSIKGTPGRLAKMYGKEVFYGMDYRKFPKCSTFENKMQYDEMIACRATVLSMCEHHFVPFMGTADIAYIPSTHIIGLSKFNRVVDFFSRRPQVQERLTAQISLALRYILKTEDVAVVLRAEHLCVRLRGPQDTNAVTVSSQLDGKFRTEAALRNEFLALTRQP